MTNEREIEKKYSTVDFVAELRRLADALEADERYVVNIYDEDIVVPASATMSVAIEVEDGHGELEFQLTWETGEDEDESSDEEEPEATA